MMLYDAREPLLEVTQEGRVIFPITKWGKAYNLEAAYVCFFVMVLSDIQRRCPMALVDLHYLCEKGRMAMEEVSLVELEAMVALVPLVAVSEVNELVLNVRHPLVSRFMLDTIVLEGFTPHLDPVIVNAASHMKWCREDFSQLMHFLRIAP